MSIEIARAYLEQFGVADRILEFDVSSATVDLAAAAVGVSFLHTLPALAGASAAGVLAAAVYLIYGLVLL